MEDECLSLTWNNHAATYRKTLSALRKENMLTDVTLACDGKKYPAHKLVLVTCSDYFREILGDISCTHPIIYMRGVAAKELQALIDFMYTGQTDVPQSEVPNLLATAEALQIKGLGVLEGKTNDCSSTEDKVEPLHRKKTSESPKVINGTDEQDKRRVILNKSNSNRDEGLDNIYSNHYASSITSPKRRKIDERSLGQSPDYTRSYSNNDKPSSTDNQSTIKNLSRKYPPLATSAAASLLSDLFQQTQTPNTSSNSYSTSSPTNPSSLRTTTAPENYIFDTVNNNGTASSPSPGVRPLSSSQPGHQHQPSSPETNSASPRALNYSLSGHGRDDFLTGGSLSHLLEDNSAGMADTPEKLLKSEIKEEALDFSSNNIGVDSPSSYHDSTVEEETRLYLDAFTRSAGLTASTLPPLEKQLNVSRAGSEDRPFVCPICQKCFAKAAILKRHHLAHFRPYVCNLCTRSFTRREVLAEHILEHNGADLRLPCPVCNMTIKRKRNLQAHIKVKHPEYYMQTMAKRKALC